MYQIESTLSITLLLLSFSYSCPILPILSRLPLHNFALIKSFFKEIPMLECHVAVFFDDPITKHTTCRHTRHTTMHMTMISAAKHDLRIHRRYLQWYVIVQFNTMHTSTSITRSTNTTNVSNVTAVVRVRNATVVTCVVSSSVMRLWLLVLYPSTFSLVWYLAWGTPKSSFVLLFYDFPTESINLAL